MEKLAWLLILRSNNPGGYFFDTGGAGVENRNRPNLSFPLHSFTVKEIKR